MRAPVIFRSDTKRDELSHGGFGEPKFMMSVSETSRVMNSN